MHRRQGCKIIHMDTLMIRLSLLVTLVMFASTGSALSLDSIPVPGGIAVITLPADADPATARYRDRWVLVTRNDGDYIAFIGLPLARKPGIHFL